MGWPGMRRVCCSNVWRQFGLLLWKNFLLQIRRPFGTFIELFFPIAAVVFIIGLRAGNPGLLPKDRCFVTFDSDDLTVPTPLFPEFSSIMYTPDNNETRAIADLIRRRLPEFNVLGVNTEEEMVNMLMEQAEAFQNHIRSSTLGNIANAACFTEGAGIVFGNNLQDTNKIEYTLRLQHEVGRRGSWQTRRTIERLESAGPRIADNFYLSEGFLHLENVVGQSIIEWRSGELQNITVNVRQFPHPPYRLDPFLIALSLILPLLLVLAFMYSAGTFVKELVLEKDSRIRESMYMMGLSQWILWSTWYLKQFIYLFISVIVMTILLKAGQVFPESNFLLLLLFFTLFILSSISFGYLVSVWFSSARLGLIMGFLAWFINFLPYFFFRGDPSFGQRVAACLLSNTCLGLGINTLTILEVRQEGLQIHNIGEDLSADDSFNMGWVFIMLTIDAVWYYVLAWYINGVKPGKYGVPRPLYFPFQPSYWTGKPRMTKNDQAQQLVGMEENTGYDGTAHEEEPKDLKVGISIQSLTKVYDAGLLDKRKAGRKVAVDRLSLNMYKDQITALLGHNGAGKTTTISVLTGLYTPTSGDAVINGFSILQNMDQIRHSLGICPQHNVLFDRLTVAEHLSFFARLKGVRGKRVGEEVDSMIEDLQLQDKREVPSSKLSGGQKRKLSVGIALVGGSEIVVLDEPTSGMDPYARRATWDLLAKHKNGRTILLTTHLMDEADLLGDRIAIMAEGRLRCSGSSLFLKSRYGVGYHMVIVKEATCDSAKVRSIVTSLVNGAQQVTDVGAELSFILPSHTSSSFPALFDALEARKTELGISTFGVSVTTMEEVFMKVGEDTDESLSSRVRRTGSILPPSTTPRATSVIPGASQTVAVIEDTGLQQVVVNFTTEEDQQQLPGEASRPSEEETTFSIIKSSTVTGTEQNFITVAPTSDYNPNTGIILWVQQFRAIFVKRFLNSLRFVGTYITQLVIPVVLVLLALVLIKAVEQPGSDPARELRLDNSAAADDVVLFWAQLNGDTFGFNDLDPSSLRATGMLDISGDVQSIIDGVQNFTRTDECCDYNYQFLDQFCATQTQASLEGNCTGSSFPYSDCIRCLSCSTARNHLLPSCTNLLYQPFTAIDVGDYCPSPPEVDIGDVIQDPTAKPFGRLDSDNTYVADHLLSVADDLDALTFFRKYQAGFVVSNRDPPYSICGCPDDTQTLDNFINPLSNAIDDESMVDFAEENFSDCVLAYRSSRLSCLQDLEPTECPSSCDVNGLYFVSLFCELNNTMGGNFEGGLQITNDLPADYKIDGFSSNLLYQFSTLNVSCFDDFNPSQIVDPSGMNAAVSIPVCSGQAVDRPVGAYYPSQQEQPAVTVWYNNQPFHMSAAALNAFHTIWLRHTTGNADLSISVTNHPLPRSAESQVDAVSGNLNGFVASQLVLIGYSFLIATFILSLVQEKENKAKHLQLLSGVHSTSYWSATFSWDLLNSLIPIAISLVLFAAFQIDAFTGDINRFGAVFMLLLLSVWASIPFAYCFSFFFKNYLTAFTLFILIYFLSAVVLQVVTVFVTVRVLQTDIVTTNQETADTLNYVFILMPGYALAQGLNEMFTNNIAREVCTQSLEAMLICNSPDSDLRFTDNVFQFTRPGIGANLTYLATEGVFFFLLTLLLERQLFWPEIKGWISCDASRIIDTQTIDQPFDGEDIDVYSERKKVLTGDTSENDVIVIKNLQKVYAASLNGCTVRPSKPAVSGVSLAVPSGECFGLLGVNGAGKTTVFRILSGDLSPSRGTALIAGYDIGTRLRDAQQRIGYCPQFDALLERLTGRELLTMFARLRGIPERLIKEVVQAEITRLDLLKHADKLSGTYSGGNKRKLSTAIALVGNSPIIMLDEPTTGMDPTTRRYLWDVLTGITQEGRSIILTSHSMEECEALCTRLAIMVNGSFKCLGSIQHLKNKYGAGYTLQAKVKLSTPPELPPITRQSSFMGSLRRFSFRRRTSQSSVSDPTQLSAKSSGAPLESPSITRQSSHERSFKGFSFHRRTKSSGAPPESPSITTQSSHERSFKRFSFHRRIKSSGAPPESPSITTQSSHESSFKRFSFHRRNSQSSDHNPTHSPTKSPGATPVTKGTTYVPLTPPSTIPEESEVSEFVPEEGSPCDTTSRHRRFSFHRRNSQSSVSVPAHSPTKSPGVTPVTKGTIYVPLTPPSTIPEESEVPFVLLEEGSPYDTTSRHRRFSFHRRHSQSSVSVPAHSPTKSPGVTMGTIYVPLTPPSTISEESEVLTSVEEGSPCDTTSRHRKFSFHRRNSQSSVPVPAQSHVKSPGATTAPYVPLTPPTTAPEQIEVPISVEGGNPYDTTFLRYFVREAFPGAIRLEEHQGLVTYQLPSAGMSWSSVFRQLEGNKERLGIVDYSISQTTLEQVFINFAKKQEAAQM